MDKVPIRPGFDAFLDEMQTLGIPVVVISGGVRQFSERKLAPYMDRITALHAVDLDLVDGKMQLRSGYDDGNELLKKTDVMALYEYKHAYGIGDSFTDMNMAQAVDTIVARDVLAQFLAKKGMGYLPYEDFDAITEAIKKRA